REEGLWTAVVSGGDAPPILQPPEHDLDVVAAFVAPLVVFHRLLARLSAWDADLYPLVFQRFSEPIGIIAPVSKQPPCLRQAAQQRRRAGVITDLAGGHEEPDRPPFGIGNGVQLGVHAA